MLTVAEAMLLSYIDRTKKERTIEMQTIKIVVTGKYACFTDPALSTERMSYPVPTPSALEGLLKAIYWKPECEFDIKKIVVFNPIRYANIRQNEVKNKIKYTKIKQQMKNHSVFPGIITELDRTQRNTMLLKDVKYGIEFEIKPRLIKANHPNYANEYRKHVEIMTRRLERGQTYKTPCLGLAQYVVDMIEKVENFPMKDIHPSIHKNAHHVLGPMLYKQFYEDDSNPVKVIGKRKIYSDEAHSVYYNPIIKNGIIDVHQCLEKGGAYIAH